MALALVNASASHATIHFESDRKSTRLNSSHLVISYAVFCLKKKKYYEQSMNPRNMWTRPEIRSILLPHTRLRHTTRNIVSHVPHPLSVSFNTTHTLMPLRNC